VCALSTRAIGTAFGGSWQAHDEGLGEEGVSVDVTGTTGVDAGVDVDLGAKLATGGVRPALEPPCWNGEANEVAYSVKVVGGNATCGIAPGMGVPHARRGACRCIGALHGDNPWRDQLMELVRGVEARGGAEETRVLLAIT
jgi:hypothetical protein